MIRMRPFAKMSYGELRHEYLEQLVVAGAVAFDREDVLGKTDDTRQGERGNTPDIFKWLADSEYKYDKLRKFLYPDDSQIISRTNLQRLLAGPEDAPASLGGNGSWDSLRQYFEEMIDTLGIPKDSEIKACKKLFRYGSLSNKKACQKESTAYWLQRQLGVKVCPYCNRMYTTTLFGENRIRPDFDHFYPISQYPYFAVSLFNLIPSCSMCNKRKGDTAEIYGQEKRENISIIYPYDESFDDPQRQISFRIIPGEKKVMTGQSDKFMIELHPKRYSDKLEFKDTGGVLTNTDVETRFENSFRPSLTNMEKDVAEKEARFWDRAKASVNLLLTESFYNEHKDEIMALLRNHYQYNQDCIELIMKTLIRARAPDAAKQDITLAARGMLYFAFLDREEWGNSPLNKLKSDILDQLDEIEDTRMDS